VSHSGVKNKNQLCCITYCIHKCITYENNFYWNAQYGWSYSK